MKYCASKYWIPALILSANRRLKSVTTAFQLKIGSHCIQTIVLHLSSLKPVQGKFISNYVGMG